MSKCVSKQELSNIRSGQTYYYITLNQFGVAKINASTPIGKKIKSYLSDETCKRFFSKRTNADLSSQCLFFPEYKLFWTRRSAELFLADNQHRSDFKTNVLNVVNRVRKTINI